MSVLLQPPSARRSEPVAAHAVIAGSCGVVLGLVLALVELKAGPVALVALAAVVLLASVGWRRPELAVLGVIALLPAGGLQVGSVELVQLTAAGAALLVLAHAAVRVAVEPPSWQVSVPLLTFVIVAAIATTQVRDDVDKAFRLDVQLVVLVLLVVAMVTGLTSMALVRRGVLILIAAGGVVALIAVLGSGPTQTYYAGGVVEGRAVGIFGQPNELGVFTAALLVLAVGTYLTSRGRATRWLCLGSGVLLLVALGLSLSRGAWMGALAGLAVLALLNPDVRRPLAKAGGATLAVLVVLLLAGTGFSTLLVERVSSLGEATSNPYDQRTQIWGEAFRQLGQHPVVGLGPGGFTSAAKDASARVGIALDVDHAHSLFLNTAVEFGTVGLVALLALMAGLMFCAVRARADLVAGGARAEAGLPPALAAALVAVSVHGLFDYPMRNAVCISTVFVIMGLLAAARRRSVRRTVVAAGDFRPLPEVATDRPRPSPSSRASTP